MSERSLLAPDGTFCRHLAFDNKPAELTESTVLQCPEARPREAAHPPSGFTLLVSLGGH